MTSHASRQGSTSSGVWSVPSRTSTRAIPRGTGAHPASGGTATHGAASNAGEDIEPLLLEIVADLTERYNGLDAALAPIQRLIAELRPRQAEAELRRFMSRLRIDCVDIRTRLQAVCECLAEAPPELARTRLEEMLASVRAQCDHRDHRDATRAISEARSVQVRNLLGTVLYAHGVPSERADLATAIAERCAPLIDRTSVKVEQWAASATWLAFTLDPEAPQIRAAEIAGWFGVDVDTLYPRSRSMLSGLHART